MTPAQLRARAKCLEVIADYWRLRGRQDRETLAQINANDLYTQADEMEAH